MCFFFPKNRRASEACKNTDCLKFFGPKAPPWTCDPMAAFGGGYFFATKITRPYSILPNCWLGAEKRLPVFGSLVIWAGQTCQFWLRLSFTTLWLCALRWSLTVDSFLHAPWCTSRFHILPPLAKYRNIPQKSPKVIFLWTSIILVSLLTPCLDSTVGCSGST